jgi:ribosome biogenesis GTPase A
MPNSSHASVVKDFEELLMNVANAQDLPDLSVYRAPLEKLVEELKTRGALRKVRIGIKQQETQEFKELMAQSKEAASRLRSALRAHFGPKNERLLMFGIPPVRKRSRPVVEEGPKPEDPAPATHPE